MTHKDIRRTQEEIERLWEPLTSTVSEDHGTTLGLPHPFVTPSWGLFHNDQFYWDSYFIIEGLLAVDKLELAQGMVENLTFLVERFGFVPMRNRTFDTGTSQPPLFTSMIRRVYEYTQDEEWLARQMHWAEIEYRSYWLNDKPADHIIDHRVFKGLSRYADHMLVHQTAEHESGSDMTSRFGGRCLDYLAVDLNCLLYAYERDFAWFYHLQQQTEAAREFEQAAKERQRIMTELMWSEKQKWFVDYNYRELQPSDFVSGAGMTALWSGVANPEQAKSMASTLETLTQPGGLVSCLKEQAQKPQKQWDYPNGWAPHQWFAIEGLLSYGETERAEELARRWIETITDTFIRTGKLWEKYDVVSRDVGKDGRYPTQVGFGWTNATYLALVKRFGFDK